MKFREVTDISSNDYFINVYGKTHNRATAYILGILVGFVVYHLNKKKLSVLFHFEIQAYNISFLQG